jgi:hypothetical protein
MHQLEKPATPAERRPPTIRLQQAACRLRHSRDAQPRCASETMAPPARFPSWQGPAGWHAPIDGGLWRRACIGAGLMHQCHEARNLRRRRCAGTLAFGLGCLLARFDMRWMRKLVRSAHTDVRSCAEVGRREGLVSRWRWWQTTPPHHGSCRTTGVANFPERPSGVRARPARPGGRIVT